MVTTFTYKPSLVRINACNFELLWYRPTNTQTNKPGHRQDQLQYTVLQLASCKLTVYRVQDSSPVGTAGAGSAVAATLLTDWRRSVQPHAAASHIPAVAASSSSATSSPDHDTHTHTHTHHYQPYTQHAGARPAPPVVTGAWLIP